MIKRTLTDKVLSLLGGNKAVTIIGARQVGKSTLLRMMLGDRENVLWINGDNPDVLELFDNITSTRLKAIVGGNDIVVIDEAQRTPNIGLRMKLITDQVGGVQVIATGSSSFELSNKINESLAGRKREFTMFPLTFSEMVEDSNLLSELRMLPHRMVYGYYPEVVSNPGNEKTILKELSDSYLYKDILALEGIGKPDKLVRLLKALALQIGSQVSYNEIGRLVGLDSKTVEKYIDILVKSYIIFFMPSFSRNLRNELKTSRKVFFWDLGIRNAVIGNMAQVENRQDAGALWENYVIAERMKLLVYQGSFAQSYFWRTKQQQEIDYIEEEDGRLKAIEIKWNPNKSATKCPYSFANAYPDAEYKVVTPRNVEEFLRM